MIASLYADNLRLRLHTAVKRHAGLGLFALFFLLYAYTAAPTFVWSDPSKLAVFSQTRYFNILDIGSHALHCFLGSVFYLLPLSFIEVAYLENLLSALYGALALLIMYHTLARIGFGVLPSVFTIVYLGVSQMFWLTSVIFESYALLSVTNALLIYFLVRWYAERDKSRYLYLLALSMLLGFSNHQITLLYAPFVALFTIYCSRRRLMTAMYWCGLLGLIACLFLVFYPKEVQEYLFSAGTVWRYFYHHDTPSANLLKGLATYFAILFYQFPFLGFFLGISGIFLFPRRQNRVFLLLLVLLALNIFFWVRYCIARHPFMHNPTYMFFSFFICLGAERLIGLHRKKALWLLIIFLAVTPLIYYYTPRILTSRGINIRRELPYRNADIYYLWPSKRGYYGAQRFAQEALNRVGHNGTLIADFTLAMPLYYMQLAGKYRPDILIFLPEKMSKYATISGWPFWTKLKRFLDRQIALKGSVYLADKYSIMFTAGYRKNQPVTSWDLINEIYNVERVWPIYRISPRRE